MPTRMTDLFHWRFGRRHLASVLFLHHMLVLLDPKTGHGGKPVEVQGMEFEDMQSALPIWTPTPYENTAG